MIGLKFEYEIDNFSGLIEILEENLPFGQKKGVYFLYDENKELLYIGKTTTDIRGRLRTHLFAEPKSCDEITNHYTLEKRKHYKYFAFSEIDKNYVNAIELFLINKFNPPFNIENNWGNGNYNKLIPYTPPEPKRNDNIYLQICDPKFINKKEFERGLKGN